MRHQDKGPGYSSPNERAEELSLPPVDHSEPTPPRSERGYPESLTTRGEERSAALTPTLPPIVGLPNLTTLEEAPSSRALSDLGQSVFSVEQSRREPDVKNALAGMEEPPYESRWATTRRALKACKDSIVATLCYSMTGVMAQGVTMGTTDTTIAPNAFGYSMIRSFFAGLATLHTAKKGLSQIGRRELGMAALVGINNTLWIPAFMYTDLASSMVIAFSAPLIHAAYAGVTKREVPSPIIATSLALTTASLFVIFNGGTQGGTLPMLGNACAFIATLSSAAYRIMVGDAASKARESQDPEVERSTKEKLDSLSFVSNAMSFGMGVLMLPFASGGLGANPLRTVALGALHGLFGGGAIHFITRANQQLSQVTTTLIGSFQVGLTPALGYLFWGSTVPAYAFSAGALTFAASGLAVIDTWMRERRQPALENIALSETGARLLARATRSAIVYCEYDCGRDSLHQLKGSLM